MAVVEDGPHGRLLDLAWAERLRREGAGASPAAAARAAAALFPSSTTAFLELGPEGLEAVGALLSDPPPAALRERATADVLAPVDPPAMRDFLSFDRHVTTAFAKLGRRPPPQVYELPVHYKADPATLIGPDAEVAWPAWTTEMDYELEVGYVVGRAGQDLGPATARRCVIGALLYDDFSARDLLRTELAGGMGPAKGKDFATAVGPWLVTADELELDDIEVSARIDGVEWSRGRTGEAMWSVGELAAWASTSQPLRVGEVLGSGTVGGGCGFELGRSLHPGAVVELEGAGLGVLRNRLGTPPEPGWWPTARTADQRLRASGSPLPPEEST